MAQQKENNVHVKKLDILFLYSHNALDEFIQCELWISTPLSSFLSLLSSYLALLLLDGLHYISCGLDKLISEYWDFFVSPCSHKYKSGYLLSFPKVLNCAQE